MLVQGRASAAAFNAQGHAHMMHLSCKTHSKKRNGALDGEI